MANAIIKQSRTSKAVRAALAFLGVGAKRQGFVSNADSRQAPAGTIEEARARVSAAEDGKVAAREFSSYLCELRNQAEGEDADGILSDVQAIVRGENGPDAFNAFSAELYGLMTRKSRDPDGSKPRAFSLEAFQARVLPDSLIDLETASEAEGGEKWAQMVLDYMDGRPHPEDVQSAIAGMRAILSGQYGPACREAFLTELRKKMVREPAAKPVCEKIAQDRPKAEQGKANTKPTEAAKAMADACASEFFSLMDIARTYGKGINGMTARHAVNGLTARIRAAFNTFDASANSKAKKEIESARVALEELDAFALDASCEAAGAGHMELSKVGRGRCLFMFTHDAAAAMERAADAMGSDSVMGEDFTAERFEGKAN